MLYSIHLYVANNVGYRYRRFIKKKEKGYLGIILYIEEKLKMDPIYK